MDAVKIYTRPARHGEGRQKQFDLGQKTWASPECPADLPSWASDGKSAVLLSKVAWDLHGEAHRSASKLVNRGMEDEMARGYLSDKYLGNVINILWSSNASMRKSVRSKP